MIPMIYAKLALNNDERDILRHCIRAAIKRSKAAISTAHNEPDDNGDYRQDEIDHWAIVKKRQEDDFIKAGHYDLIITRKESARFMRYIDYMRHAYYLDCYDSMIAINPVADVDMLQDLIADYTALMERFIEPQPEELNPDWNGVS